MALRPLMLSALMAAAPVAASGTCTHDAMVVFDGSGSMAEMGFNLMDDPRIFDARKAVAEAVPDIALVRRLGLVIYGPGGADLCSGIDLRFGPTAAAAPRIIDAVNALEPGGDTALTVAVARAAEALNYRSAPGSIVLVTDGKETCGGAPCELAAELAADAADLTVHVIGFKVRGDFFSWDSQGTADYLDGQTVARCLADRTGGLYLDTETVEELVAAFQKTLGCELLF